MPRSGWRGPRPGFVAPDAGVRENLPENEDESCVGASARTNVALRSETQRTGRGAAAPPPVHGTRLASQLVRMSTSAHHAPGPRHPTARESASVEVWLDDGLRRGERGRLAREYPVSMGPGRDRRQRVVFQAGRPVAHAMSHTVELEVDGRRLALGLVGNVYADPVVRGRGMGRACVEACVQDLAEQGVGLALLWSNLRDYYREQHFHPAGRERIFALATTLAPARRLPRTRAFAPGDGRALEALYRAKPLHARRPAGCMERFCAAPDTHVAVARRGGRVVGYAAAGRGDDFQGVVHEWAGSADAVEACIRWLVERGRARHVLASPVPEPGERALRRLGAREVPGTFALVRILDAAALLRVIAPEPGAVRLRGADDEIELRHAGGALRLDAARALDLCFGAGVAALGEALASRCPRLARWLPWPLYVWGFDSI